ncbi:M14 family metallopeptidase [Candidatus Ichthyocystis hellenicum]|uniref:M14 family metallopeptidase n=1 Tax=Candidatus Ichthyocystis hellenicum TaxID=1561003 RepID=UPI000B13699B|nr:M14-type cytosolic carboxypeptidase [Candidatus Ichthyocystis hellenicum]
MIKIDSNFDSGAIEVLEISGPLDIRLNIRSDIASEFRQWFCFKVTGKSNQNYLIRLCNHMKTTYNDGFHGYNAFVSTDFDNWTRVDCHIDGNDFCIPYTASTDFFYISYFEPYTWDRHLKLLDLADKSDIARVETWGTTKENRPICAVIVDEPGKNERKKVWLIARQHPGETMAEFFMEGFIHRLLDPSDKSAAELRQLCSFYLIPNMNPDGSVHGNLRTNSAGKNLNREWLNPSTDGSPEVMCVRNHIHEIGVDCFFDVHGDESIPYVFTDPCLENSEGKGATEIMTEMEHHLLRNLEKHCTDFQFRIGYQPGHYTKKEIMSMARGYVQETFSCPSITLEMPFKDHTPNKNHKTGWTGKRSATLGSEWVDGLLAYLTNPLK